MRMMNVETERLSSFEKWPESAPVEPKQLAKAGFYYTGNTDEVKCFCCRGCISSWEEGDLPLYKHKLHFPFCRFVQFPHKTNNLPLAKPKEMKEAKRRLATFCHWPKNRFLDPLDMAEAGFFFTGPSDKVVCAFCNGSLSIWHSGDDPFELHFKYFGDRCPFIRGESTNNLANLANAKITPYFFSILKCSYQQA